MTNPEECTQLCVYSLIRTHLKVVAKVRPALLQSHPVCSSMALVCPRRLQAPPGHLHHRKPTLLDFDCFEKCFPCFCRQKCHKKQMLHSPKPVLLSVETRGAGRVDGHVGVVHHGRLAGSAKGRFCCRTRRPSPSSSR